MNDSMKTRVFWGVWLIIVIAVLWWMSSIMAHGETHKKAPIPVIKGLGAQDLIHREKVPRQPRPYFRTTVTIKSPLIPRVYYFSATATDDIGLESDFSNEVTYTNISGTNRIITLAWDYSPGTNVITNYTIYKGLASGDYQWRYYAQTHQTLTMPIYGFPLSNFVVTVTASNALYLDFQEGIGTIWHGLMTNYWRATNPPSPRFFRARGTSSESRVYVNVLYQ